MTLKGLMIKMAALPFISKSICFNHNCSVSFLKKKNTRKFDVQHINMIVSCHVSMDIQGLIVFCSGQVPTCPITALTDSKTMGCLHLLNHRILPIAHELSFCLSINLLTIGQFSPLKCVGP